MRPSTFLIGTYTEAVPHAAYAKGVGIATVWVSREGVRKVGQSGVSICGRNPSYLAIRRETGDVYAVNEVSGEMGSLTRLRLGGDGEFECVERVECGKEPAHVCVVEGGGVVVGCFGDGSVWWYEEEIGGIGMRKVGSIRMGDGSGVHQVMGIGGGRVFVCDPLGGKVWIVRKGGRGLEIIGEMELEGYPRHGAVREGNEVIVDVVCAKNGQVVGVEVGEDGKMTVESRIEGVGNGGVLGGIKSVGEGEVVVSERRGNGEQGWIWRVKRGVGGGVLGGWGSGGKVPRDVEIGGGWVVVGNQESGEVVAYEESGAVACGKLDLGGEGAPACVLWVG